jgi:hypothetical protein
VTELPPDPDPANTPGVERGGGVVPGETPPESAQTSASANPDPRARRKVTPGVIASFIVIALLVALFLATGVLLLLKILGAFG